MQEQAQSHAHGNAAYGPTPVLTGEGSAQPYDPTVVPQSPTHQPQAAPQPDLSNLDSYLEHHTHQQIAHPQAQEQPNQLQSQFQNHATSPQMQEASIQHQLRVTAANNLQKARELAQQSADAPLELNCPQLSNEARQEAGRELARQASLEY